MPSSPAPPRARPSAPRSLASLVAVIALGVLGFLGVTVYVETRASAIDRETVLIETNSLPSVELLSAARAALWRMAVSAHEIVEEDGELRREATVSLEDARREVSRMLASEAETGPYPGETDLQRSASLRLSELDAHVGALRQAIADGSASGDDGPGLADARRDVRADIMRVDQVLQQILALNARQGHAEIGRIAQIRRDSLRLLFLLNGACVALLGAGAWVALRSVKRQRDVELAHEAMLESRSSELERFASRVAHDLLSPLAALHFTLVTVQRGADRGLPIADALERAWSCLRRSRALVEGVMDFARSGARPAGGRAHLGSVLDGVLDEARSGAAAVVFVVEGAVDTYLACSPGVLTSILSNLVGNAVKHFGETPDKAVTVRVFGSAAMARVEVEDNGPGLPPDLEGRVFEPYFRAPESRTPGLGLGLATVRRFVESHGGQAGVRAAPTSGCVFWFCLPTTASETVERMAQPGRVPMLDPDLALLDR